MPPQSSASPAGGSSQRTGLDPETRVSLALEADANPDEALLLQDRQFHILFEAALDAMVIANDQGCYVAVNQAACKLFGLDRAKLLGRSIADFTPSGFNLEQAWQCFQEREQERGEFSLMRPDGTIREIEYAATANIVPHYHLSILRDVTERKQLEQQLHQLNQDLEQQVIQRTAELQQTNQALQAVNQQLQTSQQKYETLFNILPVGVWITDAQGAVQEVNSASEQILGLSTAEQIQRTCAEFPWQVISPDGHSIAPEDRPPTLALRENRVIVGAEIGIVHPDSPIRWLCLNAAPIPLEDYGVAIAYIDITDRKQAEAALRESEIWYRRIVETANEGIWMIDADNQTIFVNPKMAEILGYAPTDMLGKSLFDFMDEDGIAIAQEQLARRRQGIAENHDFKFQHQNGSDVWTVISTNPILDEAGTYLGALGMLVDISDRKATELALQQSEATNQAILATIPDLLIQIHRDGTYLQVHRSTGVRLVALTDMIPGNHIYDILPQAMAQERMSYVEQALATNSLQIYEYAIDFDDEIRYEEARILPMEGDTALVLVRDITDRKVAEARLRRQEQEFRTLAENSPDAIMRCDRQGRFLYVNPTVAQLSGIPSDRFIGRTSADLNFAPSLVTLGHYTIEQVFSSGVPQSVEYTLPLPSSTLTFAARLVPELTADQVTSVLIVSRDITALQQAKEALAQQSARERSLRVITQHIRETLDLDDILATAVTEVQRLLQADRTLIFQLRSDRSGVVIQEVVQPGYPITLNMYWEDECFPPECYGSYIQGHARIIQNVALDRWGECLQEFMQQTAVQSKIVAPIVQQGDDGSRWIWGLLIVHACAEPRVWHSDEANVLQQVTDQLAIAIQQAELYSQVQALNINLEQQVRVRTADLEQALEFELLLQRITDQVRDSLNEDQILETVVRELGQGLGLVCCDTGIYNEDLTTSTIAHEYTQSLASARGVTFRLAEATHRDIYPFLFQGQILQFCDRVPCALRSPQEQLTVLACPILDDQRVLGDMWLYKQSDFHPSEVRLIQQVANQCAIGLRQSRLYQAAQDQVRALERLNQLKDDFLSTVSHELRTPISSIKMAIQMLELSLQSTPLLADESQGAGRYLHILKTECQREIQLINDLLDLTHLDAGTEPLTLMSADLRFLIPHIVEPFIERTQPYQQHFSLEIPEDLPICVTDLSYLERMITELLHNACKYTPAGESISLSIQAAGNDLEITIRNSGVEIAPGERDRIFERFYRIPNNDPWKHGGTGLGLALVKKLTEQLGGTIWVESGQGQTAFIVRLPRYREAIV